MSERATATVHKFERPQKGEMAMLQTGAKGPQVAELQAKLNLLGYGPLELSQSFDEPTRASLMRFQQSEALPVSGILDAASDARLNQRVLQTTNGQAMPGAAARRRPGVGETPLAPAAQPARPVWQLGLMILGGITIAGGILYYLTKDDEGEGYKRALPGRTVDHDEHTSTRYKVGPERVRRVSGAMDGVDEERVKCDRTPDESVIASGTVMEVA